MAKKVILKDQNDIELMPITRGELVLDSSGVIALHSNQFLATDSQPGLMSVEDKKQVNRLYDGVVTDDKVSQVTTTNDDNYRILFSVTADDQSIIEGSYKSSKLLFNPHTGVLSSTIFQGNLDGFYVSALSNYVKSTEEQNITVSDTLNQALGKLEYKADLGLEAYNWYKSVTQEDTDKYINKWTEIVDFIDSVEEGTDILQAFVTIGSNQTITGDKIFQNALQINTLNALTSYDSSSYSSGTNGQVLKSNGTSVYWGNDDNDKVTNTLNTTTKAYLTGTTSSNTNTNSQIFDTGVYIGTEPGYLYALSFNGDLNGNASTASKLYSGSNINGTLFTGDEDIVTALWGADRNISITDGINTSTAVSVNGSANVSLNLPETIQASFVGNLSGTASIANKLGTSDLGSDIKPIYLDEGVPKECNQYAGGTSITLNGSSKAATTASFYAPTSEGVQNYVLVSGGSGKTPDWASIDDLVNGVDITEATSGTYELVGHSGDTLYSKTGVYFNAGTACLFAAHFYETSDIKFKTDVKSITSMENLPVLREFTWKDSGAKSYGFIAQELEEQGYSELVNTNEKGTKTVNYSAALSLIVGKLQLKIEELEKEIENLKNKN